VKVEDYSGFRESGLLQEANRQFFHPLGLALYWETDEDGSQRLGLLRDEDPEGWVFEWPSREERAAAIKRAGRAAAEAERRRRAREAALGFWVQPLPEDVDLPAWED
jgi:hypothetical protein